MKAFIEARDPFIVNTYAKPDIVFTHGNGPFIIDMNQKRYVDFTSGIGVCALGHGHKRVANIIYEQANLLLHSSNLYHNSWAGGLSRTLIECTHAQGAFPTARKVFLSNSGTEANEAAIKFARKHARSLDPTGEKNKIISFHGSFHGRTFGALSATPNEKYRAPFGPMLEGFKTGTFNDVDAVKELIGRDTAGVIVEPIQGEGGINVATPQFLRALRDRCDEVGAVLIFDEIQCGLRRTGTFWAHTHPSMRLEGDQDRPFAYPDILTSAKALGNGLPVGATLVTEQVAKCIQPGDHGTTFGGNPLAARVAMYVTKRLVCQDIAENVNARAAQFASGLAALQAKYPQAVKEVRGCGLMLGVQLTDEYVPRIGELVKIARDEGVLILTAGKGVVRLLPPLTLWEATVTSGLELLGKAMQKFVGEVEGKEKGTGESANASASATGVAEEQVAAAEAKTEGGKEGETANATPVDVTEEQVAAAEAKAEGENVNATDVIEEQVAATEPKAEGECATGVTEEQVAAAEAKAEEVKGTAAVSEEQAVIETQAEGVQEAAESGSQVEKDDVAQAEKEKKQQ